MEFAVTGADPAANPGDAQPFQQGVQLFVLSAFRDAADEIQPAVRCKAEQPYLIRLGVSLRGDICLGLLVMRAEAFRLIIGRKMPCVQAFGIAVKGQHGDPSHLFNLFAQGGLHLLGGFRCSDGLGQIERFVVPRHRIAEQEFALPDAFA